MKTQTVVRSFVFSRRTLISFSLLSSKRFVDTSRIYRILLLQESSSSKSLVEDGNSAGRVLTIACKRHSPYYEVLSQFRVWGRHLKFAVYISLFFLSFMPDNRPRSWDTKKATSQGHFKTPAPNSIFIIA